MASAVYCGSWPWHLAWATTDRRSGETAKNFIHHFGFFSLKATLALRSLLKNREHVQTAVECSRFILRRRIAAD
jgi:hypothetical protein